MTLEQAIKRIQDKESQIKQLQADVRETKNSLKNLTPIKVGQKVSVDIGQTKKIVCFVSDVEYSSWRKDKFKYNFAKCKNDGTISQQSAGIFDYISVTPI